MFDIFENDAFSITRLTLAMREIKYVPSRVGQLGLFMPDSIDTLDFAIEKQSDGDLVLVASSPRGGPGQTIGGDNRSLRKLRVPHFQRDDAVNADEVQQVRAFASEVQVETLAGKIASKAARHSQHFALTEEYHRLNVIKTGRLLDADGSVLYDYFTEMGETQQAEIDFDLDNATPTDGALRKKCAGVVRQMGEILDGLPFTGIHALCGNAFFDDLIAHPEVRETYKGYEAASTLRTAYISGNGQVSSYGSFEFGGITFENYRGGGTIGVDSDKCHIFPLGVPDLFKTAYAPADYMETVNTMGQRLYAKQYPSPNGKRQNLEFQMNAIHYCSRPRVLIPGKRT
jgi:hypothetical protein